MKDVSPNSTYILFTNALKLCSSNVLKLSDHELEYLILEDLDIEYFSLFHKSTLEYLLANNLVNSEVCEQVLILREKIKRVIDVEGMRNVNAFRNDRQWHDVYTLSDNILSILGVASSEK